MLARMWFGVPIVTFSREGREFHWNEEFTEGQIAISLEEKATEEKTYDAIRKALLDE